MNAWKKFWLDTLERAANTLWQSAIMFFVANTVSGGSLWKPLISALFPPVATVILNALTTWVPVIKAFWLDVAYRAARTFLVTFVGGAVAESADLWNVTHWRILFLAAGSAALVFLKSQFAKNKFGTLTPASLATAPIPLPAAA